MSKKVLIVGGVAGGASAATRLRRLDETADIIMFERDEHISFANCGLPYYIGETIKDREKLLVQTPESMKARFNIDVCINSEVTAVDTVNKTVTVKSRETGVYKESYDYLILSPGAKALRPAIKGIENEKILTLRNIPDTDRIKSLVDKKEINSTIVIGAGYVGVEMAENLKQRGLKVSVVEAAPHILASFDSDMAVGLEKELVENGIDLILNDKVESFGETDSGVNVTLASGKTLAADMVVLAIGVAPDTGFLKESGIELGTRGHIKTNEYMETNIQNVYAVGDAVEVLDFVTTQTTAIPLAGPANKQGRIAADNVAGIRTAYKGTQGTAIIKVFGLTAASTGSNERTLAKNGIPYNVIYVHPVAHASYYPGALPLSLKLIFSDDGKIYGAQSVGYDGVDKRIDVIATAIRLGGTVEDLTELELSYAPPFSSAKDPVNMAGYVAQNMLSGRAHMIPWKDIGDLSGFTLLDVRTEMEYDNGHFDGALNIPLVSLRERLDEIDKNKPVLIYCQVGLLGYIADRVLTQKGYNVKNVTGGYKTALLNEYTPKPERGDTAAWGDGRTRTETNAETQGAGMNKNMTGRYDLVLDACGLSCPGPLLQVKAYMDRILDGQVLKVMASDPGFYEDIKAWCRRTCNEVLRLEKSGGNVTAYLKKGAGAEENACVDKANLRDNKTMVVFSGDLDKAIASFIIANGAASMGKKVTMFFTFWGLNILRKPEKVNVKKGFMDNMFGMMMPRGSKRLKLSKMNMMGMGGKMIRGVMKGKNISSLEELIESAIKSGVEVVACQMSMDVMGIKKEELLDGVKIGGVGYYLSEAEDANVNLFI